MKIENRPVQTKLNFLVSFCFSYYMILILFERVKINQLIVLVLPQIK